jgi:hypothetical protein
MAAMLVSQLVQNKKDLYRASHKSTIQSDNSLGLVLSEEKIKKITANQIQEFPWWTK